MTAGGWFGTLALFTFGVLFLVNRPLAEAVSSWHGFSPWWAVIPFTMLVLLALMRANYEEFKTLHDALNASEDDRETLQQQAERHPQVQSTGGVHISNSTAVGNRGGGFVVETVESRWDPNQEGMPEATHHVHYRLIAETPRSAPCPADWNTPVPGDNGLLQLAPGLHVRASRFVWAEYHEDHAEATP